MINVFFMISV